MKKLKLVKIIIFIFLLFFWISDSYTYTESIIWPITYKNYYISTSNSCSGMFIDRKNGYVISDCYNGIGFAVGNSWNYWILEILINWRTFVMVAGYVGSNQYRFWLTDIDNKTIIYSSNWNWTSTINIRQNEINLWSTCFSLVDYTVWECQSNATVNWNYEIRWKKRTFVMLGENYNQILTYWLPTTQYSGNASITNDYLVDNSRFHTKYWSSELDDIIAYDLIFAWNYVALTNKWIYRLETESFINDYLTAYDETNRVIKIIDKNDAPINETNPYYWGYNDTLWIYYAINENNQYVWVIGDILWNVDFSPPWWGWEDGWWLQLFCEDRTLPASYPIFYDYISTNNYITNEDTFTEKSYLSFECVSNWQVKCHSSTDSWDIWKMWNLENAFSTGWLSFTGSIWKIVWNFFTPSLWFSTSVWEYAFDKYDWIDWLVVETNSYFPWFYIYECKDYSVDPVYFVADKDKKIIPIWQKDNFITLEELWETKKLNFLKTYSSVCISFNNTNQIYNFKLHFFKNNLQTMEKEVCKDNEWNYYIDDEYVWNTDDDLNNYFVNKSNNTLPKKDDVVNGVCSGDWWTFDFIRRPICWIYTGINNIYNVVKDFSINWIWAIFHLNEDFISEPTEDQKNMVQEIWSWFVSKVPWLGDYLWYLNFYVPDTLYLLINFKLPKLNNDFTIGLQSIDTVLTPIDDVLNVSSIEKSSISKNFISIVLGLIYILFRSFLVWLFFFSFYLFYFLFWYFRRIFFGDFISSNNLEWNIISLIVYIIFLLWIFFVFTIIFGYMLSLSSLFTYCWNFWLSVFSLLVFSFWDYSIFVAFCNSIITGIYWFILIYFVYVLTTKFGRIN
jgi:hypothetical protein